MKKAVILYEFSRYTKHYDIRLSAHRVTVFQSEQQKNYLYRAEFCYPVNHVTQCQARK